MKACVTYHVYSNLDILAEVFSKMNRVSLPVASRKQLAVIFVANSKTGAFKQKSKLWKTRIHHHVLI
jgi:hypothetical protein